MDFKDAFGPLGARRLTEILGSLGDDGARSALEPGNPGGMSGGTGSTGGLSEAPENRRSAGGLEGLEDRLIQGFASRELMDRSRLVTTELVEQVLPRDPQKAAEIIHQLAQKWQVGLSTGMTSEANALGFWYMAFCECITRIFSGQPQAGLEHLRELTVYFSAEFAVRPLILEDPEAALVQMAEWIDDPHPGVRRLVSEGTRTRLPWGIRLNPFISNPAPLVPLLRALRDDPDEVVRRSVANNLNDIAKDHPDFCAEVLVEWDRELSEVAGQDELVNNRRALIRHAGRTLVKKAHPVMLELLGFAPLQGVEIHRQVVEPELVPWQGRVRVSWQISISQSGETRQIAADFIMHRMTASGRLAAKVWKGPVLDLQPGQPVEVSKEFSFAPVTTRRYYPGSHRIELQLNGQVYAGAEFTLAAGSE
jgi:3-methyladenine DNA glycosylase AlkC